MRDQTAFRKRQTKHPVNLRAYVGGCCRTFKVVQNKWGDFRIATEIEKFFFFFPF